jgi:hydroxyethylthiazole kinase-like uncharacterized protein yjeF
VPEKFDALLVGPGLAAPGAAEIKATVQGLWANAPIPIIADATALDWLPRAIASEERLRVITPHPGEAGRMLGTSAAEVQADRTRALRELSRQFGGCWVVLKGHHTLIGRSTGSVFVNSSGNPHLAQGGSGDLLAGYLAGLVAQPSLRSDPTTTLRYGVWEHGAAADLLQSSRPGWIVEELATALGARRMPPGVRG